MFWQQPQQTLSTDILISVSSVLVVWHARSLFAAYDNVANTAKAFAAVVFAALGLAFFFCLFEPRREAGDYLKNARACYKVLALSIPLSAGLISTNALYPWAERLGDWLDLYSETLERIWILCLIPAVFSFFVILGVSTIQQNFFVVLKRQKIKSGLWLSFFFLAFCTLNYALFSFPRT
jgi:hypothetical protein